ncbi:iron hydrogenase [Hesseltinella vesiculosa]|uniref:Iron hydrogenase n=1 Tax=Hesseltinella vesiculosa TaxID=101127 RepID=A0A1X2GQ70_9FUNG|nr:iron hydrogenase [Hesseltinella vesiculosa]
MAFSSALTLTDLNDYIAPSQACIKPVEVKKSDNPQGSSEIKVDDQGGYYEISKDGGEEKLEQASITLNDCLACSGCVTSAESVLITMQSQEELYKVLRANNDGSQPHKTIVVSISPQSRASLAAKYQLSMIQVHQRLVAFFKHHLGVHHVFDIAFARDLSLVEGAREFIERYQAYLEQGGDALEKQWQEQQQQQDTSAPRSHRRQGGRAQQQQQQLPMLASSCPGWVCYAEKTHGEVLPFISTTKSPQQMMGSLVKDYLATKTNTRPDQIYHVAVMPCYDKKLEASRPDFFQEEFNTRDVDCVLSTGEVDKMLTEQSVDFLQLPDVPVDDIFNKVGLDPVTQALTAYGTEGSSSGGALEYILACAAKQLFHMDSVSTANGRIVIKTGKNADFKEYFLHADDGRVLLRFASAYGFRNIQNIVRKVKSGKCSYHFVEVMACPGGCANGGGQLPPQQLDQVTSVAVKDWVQHVEAIYRTCSGVPPDANDAIQAVYNEWMQLRSPDHVAKLLRTQYHAVTQNLGNPLATKW